MGLSSHFKYSSLHLKRTTEQHNTACLGVGIEYRHLFRHILYSSYFLYFASFPNWKWTTNVVVHSIFGILYLSSIPNWKGNDKQCCTWMVQHFSAWVHLICTPPPKHCHSPKGRRRPRFNLWKPIPHLVSSAAVSPGADHQAVGHRHGAHPWPAAPPHHAHHGLRPAAIPAPGEHRADGPREALPRPLLAGVPQAHDCRELPGQPAGKPKPIVLVFQLGTRGTCVQGVLPWI